MPRPQCSHAFAPRVGVRKHLHVEDRRAASEVHDGLVFSRPSHVDSDVDEDARVFRRLHGVLQPLERDQRMLALLGELTEHTRLVPTVVRSPVVKHVEHPPPGREVRPLVVVELLLSHLLQVANRYALQPAMDDLLL